MSWSKMKKKRVKRLKLEKGIYLIQKLNWKQEQDEKISCF